MARPLEAVGVRLIQAFEGLRLAAYDDYDGKSLKRDTASGRWLRPNGIECLGYPTIGWGQRIWSAKYYGPCTRGEADQWLIASLDSYVSAVDRQCPGTTPNERGALASYCYNCGAQGLVTSKLPALRARGATLEEIKRVWLNSKVTSKGKVLEGLRIRRAKEYALYATPMPTEAIDVGEVMAQVELSARKIVAEFV